MFVETKTKESHNVQYKNWKTISKIGSVLNANVRGGSIIQAEQWMKLTKLNPPHMNNPWNETIHVAIPFKDDKLHFFLTYIHHTSNKIEENLLIKAAQYKYAIIIGDLNFNTAKRKQINQFMKNSDFVQLKTPPTFIMENNPNSTPDAILYTKNIQPNIKFIELTPDLGSDHLALEFTLDLDATPTEYPQENIFLYDKCNIDEVNQQMCQWIDMQGNVDITP